MRVVYLLNGAALYGGVKVVLQHARALRRLGVDATVASTDPPPPWFPDADTVYRRVASLAPDAIGPTDIAIGTIWFTVPAAVAVPGAVAGHLCQCYEAGYHGVADHASRIDDVYRLPTFKLAVSPHLVELLRRRFGIAAAWIPQPFEPHVFHPPASEGSHPKRLRVLISGQWHLDIKGVQWGMRALAPLRAEGGLELVRLSLDAPPEELEFWPDAERHVAVAPAEVPAILRSVDLVLSLSTEVEGFGLPLLEAMGCGRACVATDIGAVRALDPAGRAALRVACGDHAALQSAVRRLRTDVALRRRLGAAGREIALQFDEERTARALLGAFTDALSSRPSRAPR